MKHEEHAFLFDCAGTQSVGIVSRPAEGPPGQVGLLIVVGGPQYRVGSHRLFVQLARHAAEQGLPAMRFDYRGMGDSLDSARSFESVDADLACAVDAFVHQVPSLRRIVIWGLCDGASAACMYAPHDARVSGLILVNPWVRTDAGQATTRLRHYYVQRLLSRTFWAKVLQGKVGLQAAIELKKTVLRVLRKRRASSTPGSPHVGHEHHAPLPERLGRLALRSKLPLAFALSQDDAVAREFEDQALSTPLWQKVVVNQLHARIDLPEADHTVSGPQAAALLCERTVAWARAMAAR